MKNKKQYRLMIVDDERMEIDILTQQFDFAGMQIELTAPALNAEQARRVLLGQHVDMMLCDIEMPGESGLELLMWVREHQLSVECIFLTNFAEFDYARKAVELDGVDYLLKPVDPALLTNALERAKQRIDAIDGHTVQGTFSDLWLQHQRLIAERFWKDVVIQDIPATREGVSDAAKRLNLPGVDQMYVMPIFIMLHRWLKVFSPGDLQLMVFGIRNIADEILFENATSGIIFEYARGSLIGLIYLEDSRPPYPYEAANRCRQFVELCQKSTFCIPHCYIGEPCRPYQLSGMMERLFYMERMDIQDKECVHLLQDHVAVKKPAAMPDMSTWPSLLNRGMMEDIIRDLEIYYGDEALCRQIDAESLTQFRSDFLQLIAVYCQEKGVKLHQLLSEDGVREYTMKDKLEISEVLAWSKNILRAAKAYTIQGQAGQDVVEQVKKYVAQNISQKISRQDIADSVYLSLDYLTKIFRKRTGMKLSDYITQERINLAKKLLETTELSITDIAIECGYANNISYFSNAFKTATGHAPLQYRRLSRSTVL